VHRADEFGAAARLSVFGGPTGPLCRTVTILKFSLLQQLASCIVALRLSMILAGSLDVLIQAFAGRTLCLRDVDLPVLRVARFVVSLSLLPLARRLKAHLQRRLQASLGRFCHRRMVLCPDTSRSLLRPKLSLGWQLGATRIQVSSRPMFWKAASNFQ